MNNSQAIYISTAIAGLAIVTGVCLLCVVQAINDLSHVLLTIGASR